MATIKDVAKQAGVGIATVSRVINQHPSVSADTKEKVLHAIADLNYTPNQIARNMTAQKSGIIAFVVPFSSHIFFSEMIYHVERLLAKHHLKLMVCNSGADAKQELDLLGMLAKNQVDGIILLTSNNIENKIDPTKPLISFDRRLQGVPFVSSDNYQGGQLAAKCLVDAGAKNILFIGDDAQGELSSIDTEVSKRRRGFKDYLDRIGFSDYEIIEYPQGDMFIPKPFIKTMINARPDVDGIFTISDELAHFVIKVLHEAGRRVPEDVRVIGYDGTENPFMDIAPITSVRQPVEAMADYIVKQMVNRLSGGVIDSQIFPVSIRPGTTCPFLKDSH